MEKLSMCRICLVQSVRMYIVVNKNLHVLYEKLTDVPFVTEDSRPMLACFMCFTKLKQCYQLLSRCMEAEKLFTQIMNRDSVPQPLSHQEHFNGFITTPVEIISVVDAGQTASIVVKEELRAGRDGLGGAVQPKEEQLSDGITTDLPSIFKSSIVYLRRSAPDLHQIKMEPPKEYSLSNKKRILRIDPQMGEKSDTSAEYVPLYQSQIDVTIMEIKSELDEQQETYVKRRTAKITGRASGTKTRKLEDKIKAKHKENEQAHARIIRTSQHHTSEHITTFTECLPDKPEVNNSINDTTVNTNADLKRCKEKPYKCDICQSSFGRPGDLKRHFLIHSGKKPWKCEICGCCFSHSGHLSRHSRIHTGVKPYKCDICQRSFSQVSNLKRHSLLHKGDKPYQCVLCQHCYIDKRDLMKHIREHIGERPYTCDICRDSFNDKRELTKHIRKHTGKKLFKCEECQSSFTYTSDLMRHVRIHTGEKPYECDICRRGFNIKSNLRKHLRIHTRDTDGEV